MITIVRIFPIVIWPMCERLNPMSEAGNFDLVDM